jgi:hypothetical protein
MFLPTDFVAYITSILPYVQVAAVGIAILATCHLYLGWAEQRPLPGLPIAKMIESPGPRESFSTDAQGTIKAGLEKFSGPFQIITGTGPKMVLPNKYADELRGRSELDFNEAFRKDFFAHYPGFEAFRSSMDNPDLIPLTLRTKVSQSLPLITTHLVNETTLALPRLFGDQTVWTSIEVKQNNLRLIARLSSRVFLGKPACHDESWLEIVRDHTCW